MGSIVALMAAALIASLLASWNVARLRGARAEVLERFKPRRSKAARRGRLTMPDWAWRLADQLTDTGRRFGGGSPDGLRAILLDAGEPDGLTVERFLGLRALFGLAGIVAALLLILIGLGPFWMAVLPLLGFFGPLWWLKGQARERQLSIARSLPDFLDTVAISMEAGMSMDRAFVAVGERLGGPLGEEILRYSREVELAVPREDALGHVLKRNSCKELSLLLQSLVQSYRLGVPVAGVMAQQAQHIRRLRAEKAKEQAAKASPKMTLATSFLMMPAVLFLVIGMVVLNLIYNGDHMGVSGFFN